MHYVPYSDLPYDVRSKIGDYLRQIKESGKTPKWDRDIGEQFGATVCLNTKYITFESEESYLLFQLRWA